MQTTWSAGWFTSPVGFTVMLKVLVVPIHETPPFVKVGVTTMVASTGDVPVLRAVKAGIFPEPLAPRPMLVVPLVQV